MAITFTGASLATYNDTPANDSFQFANGQIDNDPGPAAQVGSLQDSTANPGNYRFALTGTGVTTGNGFTSIATQFGTLTVFNSGQYSFSPNQAAINALAAGTTQTISVNVNVNDLVDGDTGAAVFSLTFNGGADAPTFGLVGGSAGTLATYTDTAANDSFAVASGRIDNNPSATTTTGVGQLSGDTGSTYTYLLNGANGTAGGVSTLRDGAGTIVGYAIAGTYGTLTLATDGRYQYVPDNARINAVGAGVTPSETFQITAVDSNGTQSAVASFRVNITGAQETAVSLTGGQLAAFADTTATGDAFGTVSGQLDTDKGGTTNGVGNLDGGTGAISFQLSGGTVVTSANGETIGTRLTNEFGTLTLFTAGGYQFTPISSAIDTLPASAAPRTLTYNVIATDAAGSTATAAYTIALTGATDPQTLTTGVLATYNDTTGRDTFALASGMIDTNPTATSNGVGQFRGDQGTRTYTLTDAGAVNILSGATVVGQQINTFYGTLTLAADGRYQFEPNQNAINGLTAGENPTLSFTVRLSNDTGLTTTTTNTDGTTTTTAAPVVSTQTFTINLTGANDTALTLQGGSLATYTDSNAVDTFATIQGSFDTDATTGRSAGSTTSEVVANSGVAPTSVAVVGGNLEGGTGTATYALTGAGVTALTTGSGANTTTVGYRQDGTYGTFIVGTDGRYLFDPNDSAVDGLRAGQTVVLSYTVQATTGTGANAATASSTYTITLIGGNDAPTVGAVTQTLTETDAALVASGTIATTGAAGDTFTYTASTTAPVITASSTGLGTPLGGTFTLTAAQQQAFASALTVNQTTGAYTFNLASPDYLDLNQTVTAQYTYNVTDQNGLTTPTTITITVNGALETVTGATDGSDVLTGGMFGDLINGGVGDDIIRGMAGNDELNGGSGDDQLYGGAGNDILRGGSGDDLLGAGAGRNIIDGGDGRDTALFTGASTDYQFTRTADGTGGFTFLVARGGESTQVVNVEFLQFSDGLFAASANNLQTNAPVL